MLTVLTPAQFDAIKNAIDTAMDEYAENNKVIFANESARIAQHFQTIKRGVKEWQKSKKCMIPSCTKRSIKRSHTVPKGMSLSAIAERGHLLEPVFDQKIGRIEMKTVGASNATTFPGFCSDHEHLFESFETQKSISTESHIYLQIYRVACRESFRTRFLIEQQRLVVASYTQVRDEGLVRIVREKVFKAGVPDTVDFKSLTCQNDPLLLHAEGLIGGIESLSVNIDEQLLPGLEQAVFSGSEQAIYVNAFKIDIEIPAAVSGCGTFAVLEDSIRRDVTFLLNVVPAVGETLLIVACEPTNKTLLDSYLSAWMKSAFTILSMIESWMVNGTDQWCIKPSVWNALPKTRKRTILDDIFRCEINISQEYHLSIFDELRKKLLTMLADLHKVDMTAEVNEFIATQRAKMV